MQSIINHIYQLSFIKQSLSVHFKFFFINLKKCDILIKIKDLNIRQYPLFFFKSLYDSKFCSKFLYLTSSLFQFRKQKFGLQIKKIGISQNVFFVFTLKDLFYICINPWCQKFLTVRL